MEKLSFRVVHRYLGFFLAGIMTIYALSGITLIFRTTDAFKMLEEKVQEVPLEQATEDLGRALRIRNLNITNDDGNVITFDQGTYDRSTGIAEYSAMELPTWLDKITHLHKATTNDPLYYFNIFFGLSLLFFAISSFFMFLPKTPVFKKGLYFTLAGILLAIIMLII